MFTAESASKRSVRTQRLGLAVAAVLCLSITGCQDAKIRTFEHFMDDRLAREGTLARCNSSRPETASDIECANARRAEAVISLAEEREKRLLLEKESERKLTELRTQMAREQESARRALAEAEAARLAAYEASWTEAPTQMPAAAADGDLTADMPATPESGSIVAPAEVLEPDGAATGEPQAQTPPELAASGEPLANAH